ncbi:MAG TPA: hypothetical protein VJS47_09775 [Rhizomicrobium sp.]|nr:hypothetical protein [Rhizomicrobium sp.]
MNSVTSAPTTAAIFAVLTALLSSCMAYDAASTMVDTGASVISTTGDIVTAPFGSDESGEKPSK